MKRKLVIVFITLATTTAIVYFILDKQLYYYGKSDFNFYQPLPLKIKPVFMYDFEGGFHLEDEDGFRSFQKELVNT